jgi:hypothetical protein
VLIGSEFWFLPSEICEYNQNTKKEDCSVSNATSHVIWHFVQFLKDNANVLNVFSTVAIAIFTGVLWHTTHKMLQANIVSANAALKAANIAEAAANAAREAAEAMPRVERAYLFLHHNLEGKFELVVTPDKKTVTIKLANHGRTPAIINEILFGFLVGPHAPRKEDLAQVAVIPIPGGIIVSSEPYSFTRDYNITADHRAGIENKTHFFFMVGRVKYHDVFGVAHETGFCRRHGSSGFCILNEQTDLEYHT